MKVVISDCYGGFGLNEKAIARYNELSGRDISYDDHFDIDREDEHLIQVVEEMGEEANAACSKLVIIEIPNDINWYIEEYDGTEWVAEIHRTWP